MSAAALFEISTLLNTGLDKPTLAVLVELIGIPPVPPPRPSQASGPAPVCLLAPETGCWTSCPAPGPASRPPCLLPREQARPACVFAAAARAPFPLPMVTECAAHAESGVNPESLAHVVKELRRESAALQRAELEAQGARAIGL